MADKYMDAWYGYSGTPGNPPSFECYMNITGAAGANGSAGRNDAPEYSRGAGEHEIPEDLDAFYVYHYAFSIGEDNAKADFVSMTHSPDVSVAKDRLVNPDEKIPDNVNAMDYKNGVCLPIGGFQITKQTDLRSAALLKACMTGKGFAAAQMFLTLPGNAEVPEGFVAYHFIFRDLYVTGVNFFSGNESGLPQLPLLRNGRLDCGDIRLEVVDFHVLHGWLYAIQYREDGSKQIVSGR